MGGDPPRTSGTPFSCLLVPQPLCIGWLVCRPPPKALGPEQEGTGWGQGWGPPALGRDGGAGWGGGIWGGQDGERVPRPDAARGKFLWFTEQRGRGRLRAPPGAHGGGGGGQLVGPPQAAGQGSALTPAGGVRPPGCGGGSPGGRAALVWVGAEPGLSPWGVGVPSAGTPPPQGERGTPKIPNAPGQPVSGGGGREPPPPRDGDTSGCRGDDKTGTGQGWGLCHGGTRVLPPPPRAPDTGTPPQLRVLRCWGLFLGCSRGSRVSDPVPAGLHRNTWGNPAGGDRAGAGGEGRRHRHGHGDMDPHDRAGRKRSAPTELQAPRRPSWETDQ